MQPQTIVDTVKPQRPKYMACINEVDAGYIKCSLIKHSAKDVSKNQFMNYVCNSLHDLECLVLR